MCHGGVMLEQARKGLFYAARARCWGGEERPYSKSEVSQSSVESNRETGGLFGALGVVEILEEGGGANHHARVFWSGLMGHALRCSARGISESASHIW
jgi:hypothetical protein